MDPVKPATEQGDVASPRTDMKRIVALIPGEALRAVQSALVALDVGGLTVEVVQDQDPGLFEAGERDLQADHPPLFRLEVLTQETALEPLLEAIRVWAREEALRPRGMIFVLPMDSIVRVRTGECQTRAL